MINQWEPGVWTVKKLQVQLAKKNKKYRFCSLCIENSSCYNDVRRWLSSLWTRLSTSTWDGITPSLTASRSYSLWNIATYCTTLKTTTTKSCELVCLTYCQSDNISAWWSGVTFYRKIPAGHLRRDEFRVVSYRKIQWHLSHGSSFTMALGGGPWS